MIDIMVCPRCGNPPMIRKEQSKWYATCLRCSLLFHDTREEAIANWNRQPYVIDLIRKIMILESRLSQALEEQIENDSLDS